MQELFHALGIDWKILIAQGANFLVVLLVLTFVLFRPLIKILNERRKKIEAGLIYTEEAEKKLHSISEEKALRLREADEQALFIVEGAKKEAGRKGDAIVDDARRKGATMLLEAERTAEREKLEAMAHLRRDSRELLRTALLRAIALKPEAVDEALLGEAVNELKKQS